MFLNFRDHPINFNYEKITFENETLKEVQQIKNSYIQANIFLQGAVTYAAKKLYIENTRTEKNIILNFAQNVSYRYFIVLKGIAYYELLITKQNTEENSVIEHVKKLLKTKFANEQRDYWLGHLSDPEKLFNIISCKNPTGESVAEFRYRLFFVYKMMPFVEKYILKKYSIFTLKSPYDEIRHYIKRHETNWKINKECVKELKRRSSQKKSKFVLYCPGTANELNSKELRRDSDEKSQIYKDKLGKLRFPTYRQVIYPEATNRKSSDIKDFMFNKVNFSQEEIQEMTKRNYRSVLADASILDSAINAQSGATTYDYIEDTQNIEARKFLDLSNDAFMPRLSGISGTMDYSISMACIVGLGVDNNSIDFNYLHVIKLAYIVWMSQAQDHSLHEMLFSALSYGLNYQAGPNVINYILPNNEEFKEKVKKVMEDNEFKLPIEYYNDYCIFIKKYNKDLKYEYALETISSCRATGRMVSLINLKVEVQNIKDPATSNYGTYQPNKVDKSKGTYQIYNLKTRLLEIKNVNNKPKVDKKFTKKLATTIVRPDGNLKFFGTQNVGLLFNILSLNTKQYRYVFSEDVQTNLKWWVGENDINRENYENYFIDINFFRSLLIYKSMIREERDKLNESLFGLCKDALVALFIQIKDPAKKDQEILLLTCFYYYIKKELNISLPILEFKLSNPGDKKTSYLNIISINDIVNAFARILLDDGYLNIPNYVNHSITLILNELKISFSWVEKIKKAIKINKDQKIICEDIFKRKILKLMQDDFISELQAENNLNFYHTRLEEMYKKYNLSNGSQISLNNSITNSSVSSSITEIAGSQVINTNSNGGMSLPPPPPPLLDFYKKRKGNRLLEKFKHVKIIFDTDSEIVS
ncbi:hypothetical protein QEJ31_05370 [Pigmentibacter sp. JX0631]|uniref:hypothetical protein n=1 Tax=Pigmentibacter sp. JX0631 TaxID=2976982 RepID=UPI0024697B0A|nr:hypothetical protein [Pigmentibacter sp. JX0631]WGL61023.1 hypothetical protein QEJ31_05370 [Pigmentibacter sp. JX0631]